MLILAHKTSVPYSTNNNSLLGLGVCSLHAVKFLQQSGIAAESWGVLDGFDLDKVLATRDDVTHLVLQAPFFDTAFLRTLLAKYPHVLFSVLCHSNFGFLAVDQFSVTVIREHLDVERTTPNFVVSGNSRRYCDGIEGMFRQKCLFLPNLYPLSGGFVTRPLYYPGEVLNIGVYGATRVLKNLFSGVAAGIMMATTLRVDAVISLNSGRVENGAGVTDTIKALANGLPHITIREIGWVDWATFRREVANQNILLSPSFSESHNLVTADGVAEGVVNVVGPSVEWLPLKCHASPDDVSNIANTGIKLLKDRNAPQQCFNALQRFNSDGFDAWLQFLEMSA